MTADKGKIDKKGRVVFAVPGASSGSPVSYRVDGPGSASTPVSTDSWGTDLDFRDEFGGSKLDLTRWQHRQPSYQPAGQAHLRQGRPQGRQGRRRHRSAEREGRQGAQLTVQAEEARQPEQDLRQVQVPAERPHRHPDTHSITYGVVAARIKFQPLQGQHASLWMQPTYASDSTSAAKQGTEIDIIEWFGKDVPNGGLTSFIYAPSHGGKKIALGGEGGWIKKPEQYLTNEKDDWYKRYHVFSVEWNPSGYIFRIDGQETGRINKGVSGVPSSRS